MDARPRLAGQGTPVRGGKGADVRYVRSRENRSAGSYMGNKLEPYCSRQRFRMLAVR
jgi:hypothetical protein